MSIPANIYPKVTNNNFYQFINKKYARYKIPKRRKTLKQLCFPKKYELQIPQKFLAEFINPKTPYKGILVYYKIGSGKTCTAINIAEKFKHLKKILIVVPASLKGNFRAELRSPCAGEKYLTNAERDLLKKLHPTEPAYREIIRKSDERINKYYNIYSYNKFVELLENGQLKLRNTLLIIDEIHNMISETGIYYEVLKNAVDEAPSDLRLVIMSATPIFDKPIEIALTMNLLIRGNEMPSGTEFVDTFMNIKYTKKGPKYEVKNMDLFERYVRGYVSYYRGAPPNTFPRSELHFVRCKMSEPQQRLYRKIVAREARTDVRDFVNVDISNSFFIGTRMVSNFMYPNKQINEKGYASLEDDDLSLANLRVYSSKFVKILRKIKKCDGTVFVYSNFREYGGIRPFVRMLEHHHYRNYEVHGGGRKRFALWVGGQDPSYREEIKTVFNNKINEDGSSIKVIIASQSAKEGISFLRVQQVHIMEPYWNFSRLEQIIGRAIRFCSHKDVIYDKQLVEVYIYMAVHPKVGRSIDERIMQMAIQKKLVNKAFETALKEAAIDCELFKNANVYPGEEDIKCVE